MEIVRAWQFTHIPTARWEESLCGEACLSPLTPLIALSNQLILDS